MSTIFLEFSTKIGGAGDSLTPFMLQALARETYADMYLATLQR